MPRVREEPAQAFAHCVDPLCEGMAQASVEVVRTTTELTCRDLGGDSNLVERSATTVRLVNDAEAKCPSCGSHRDVTEQKRPNYAPLSGVSQDGLLKLLKEKNALAPATAAPAVDELAAMRAQLEELQAQMAQKANKPGPKAA